MMVRHISREEVDAQIWSLGPRFLWGTLIGFGFLKPHGYSGDFEMIDRIHTRFCSRDPMFSRWDLYFHQFAAVQAVRNRKEYFKDLVDELIRKRGDRGATLKVLNLGSGPCRDIVEFLDADPSADVDFTCVDQDRQAIQYAQKVCARHINKVRFVEANILRYSPERKFDLVWSAGVADYLNDRSFAALLSRARRVTEAMGEIVIGNFSNANPSRDHMEILGRWYLIHRSEQELVDVCRQAGVDRRMVQVDAEPLGVNLFVRIAN